jgi:hypothetical protein
MFRSRREAFIKDKIDRLKKSAEIINQKWAYK